MLKVQLIASTPRPNLVCYLALHQCYSEGFILDEYDAIAKKSDEELGRLVVEKCIKFGHYSVIEHPSMTFAVQGFPHSVMVQATRHRTLSFSVQSQRYTSKRVVDIVTQTFQSPKEHRRFVEEVFYFRPVCSFLDRENNKYYYSQADRDRDIDDTFGHIETYYHKVENQGYAPEHARDCLPQNIRQDFVVTFNPRSLLHFCDLRTPKDAQREIQMLAEMLFNSFSHYMPEVAKWYDKNRLGKNKLAP